MVIAALCDYYDLLAKKNKVLPEGYSAVKIHYLVSLTPEGKIANIINYKNKIEEITKKGETKIKEEPRLAIMPKRTEKSAIDANIIEHRPIYLFGLNLVDKNLEVNDKTNKAVKSHAAFKKKHLEFLEDLNSELINAYRNFILTWQPIQETANQNLLGLENDYASSGFAFCLQGRPDLLLHEDPAIKLKWEKFLSKHQTEFNEEEIVCAIIGEKLPRANIHSKIRGLRGGQTSGSTMISFNKNAEKSYGKEQSHNCNISELAMKKYTEALNNLLQDKSRTKIFDDITVLHWAIAEEDSLENNIIASLFSEGELDALSEDEVNKILHDLLNAAKNGIVTQKQIDEIGAIKKDIVFYIVGLKPNVSRIALKFIYKKTFGEILRNLAQHQLDMQLSETGKPISLWQIKRELISPKSDNEHLDPALFTKMLDAAIQGYEYPRSLLYTAIRRVKTDADDEKKKTSKINPVRAGIIKACLNRYFRNTGKKEAITMSLDKNNQNPAYLCGRLFAVLEKVQQEAANNKLNRTIKDAYFASACSQPAIIFPKLMVLAQNHLNKISPEKPYFNYQIGDIIGMLNSEFPQTLTLIEQGKFIIGYYQQFFYKSAKNKPDILINQEKEELTNE